MCYSLNALFSYFTEEHKVAHAASAALMQLHVPIQENPSNSHQMIWQRLLLHIQNPASNRKGGRGGIECLVPNVTLSTLEKLFRCLYFVRDETIFTFLDKKI